MEGGTPNVKLANLVSPGVKLLRQGLSDSAARRQVCRAILSTVRAIWRKGEAYRDNPLK